MAAWQTGKNLKPADNDIAVSSYPEDGDERSLSIDNLDLAFQPARRASKLERAGQKKTDTHSTYSALGDPETTTADKDVNEKVENSNQPKTEDPAPRGGEGPSAINQHTRTPKTLPPPTETQADATLAGFPSGTLTALAIQDELEGLASKKLVKTLTLMKGVYQDWALISWKQPTSMAVLNLEAKHRGGISILGHQCSLIANSARRSQREALVNQLTQEIYYFRLSQVHPGFHKKNLHSAITEACLPAINTMHAKLGFTTVIEASDVEIYPHRAPDCFHCCWEIGTNSLYLIDLMKKTRRQHKELILGGTRNYVMYSSNVVSRVYLEHIHKYRGHNKDQPTEEKVQGANVLRARGDLPEDPYFHWKGKRTATQAGLNVTTPLLLHLQLVYLICSATTAAEQSKFCNTHSDQLYIQQPVQTFSHFPPSPTLMPVSLSIALFAIQQVPNLNTRLNPFSTPHSITRKKRKKNHTNQSNLT